MWYHIGRGEKLYGREVFDMADEHFWDNGLGERSTSIEYKLRYENLEGQVIDTEMTTLDKAAGQFEQLKSAKQTAWCELLHCVNGEETSQQRFEFKVMDIGGVKIIL